MKRYVPWVTYPLGVVSAVFFVVFAVGLIIRLSMPDEQAAFVLILVGGIAGSFSLAPFIALRNSPVLLYRDRVVFSTDMQKNGKPFSGRAVIKFDDIEFIDRNLVERIPIWFTDNFNYLLKLKDGTEFSFFLYAYGRRTEDEIIGAVEYLLHQSRTASAKRTDKK